MSDLFNVWHRGDHVEPPLVSVIIPCYNQAGFLAEAVESVLSQSHKQFEIIVIDDGSTDNTSEVAACFPNVRYINQENQGLSGARNTGMCTSKGSYLVFLDADDRLLPNALEAGLNCLNAHPDCAFVSGRYRMIREDGSTLADVPQTPIENGHYLALLRGNYIGMHATVVFRRPVLELVGGFDTSLQAAEDYDLYLRIARRYPIARHATLVAEYRQHGSNMGRDSARMLTSVLAVLRKQRIYVKGNPNYKEAYRTGIRYWQRYYGAPLTKEVRAHLEAHQWKQALLNTLVLLRYAPSALIEAGQRLPLHLQGWLGKSFPRRRRRLDPIRFGNLRRLTPFSREFGFDRGQPIDRYYIERFLASHTPDIRGHVLEVGDDFYTRKFGGDRVVRCDVLHVSEGNPNATIVADLTRAGHIPSESFDCIIFTQTLHLIYEVRAALETLHRILKPGGVLLTTVPGVSQISDDEWADSWYWAFTTLSAGRLFGEVFPTEKVWVEAHGNVLAASAFLYGLAVKELRQQELDYHDPHYQLLITVRAVKPGMTC